MAGSMEPTEQLHIQSEHNTRVLPVDSNKIGQVHFSSPAKSFLQEWNISLSENSLDAKHLMEAATQLRTGNTPVAFPTETVYGLGADATRSSAVLGIYAAKQRPADNPLIVHISSLSQLRRLLRSPSDQSSTYPDSSVDSIPPIYHPLISRFWPGPLTIILPLPSPSPLAPQVTASLPTFGARMPSSLLALVLIRLADTPIAAPSANTSTKPSPTTAAHVLQDLSGRIDLILDGGPCDVGVESTVVDGLSYPPVVLRPGSVSIEMLRQYRGWERVVVGYKDVSKGMDGTVPRAPGMKYRHYSPKAKVILVKGELKIELVKSSLGRGGCVGVIKTKTWTDSLFTRNATDVRAPDDPSTRSGISHINGSGPEETQTSSLNSPPALQNYQILHGVRCDRDIIDVWVVGLGTEVAGIARGLFAALRELDLKGVDVIFVESIRDSEGDTAAAVMNRLGKAAQSEFKT